MAIDHIKYVSIHREGREPDFWAYKDTASLERDLANAYGSLLERAERTSTDASTVHGWIIHRSPEFNAWTKNNHPFAFFLGSQSEEDRRLDAYFESAHASLRSDVYH